MARLILEDGAVFTGMGFGAPADAVGEVVFCTAMTGYQEAISDPSYRGQILTLTASHIGNYGVCGADVESGRPQIAALIVKDLAAMHSNCRAEGDLSTWLASAGIPGLAGIDTRALVRRLRGGGVMRGMLVGADAGQSTEALLAQIRQSPEMSGQDLATAASRDCPAHWEESLDRWWPETGPSPDRPYRVVAIDCGAKRNIYRHLVSNGCEVHVVPSGTSAEAILEFKPEGVFISNGPGDPAAVTATIETLKCLMGQVPMFGICLGHQLLALALGASTWKLPFGHRGANQPVREEGSGRILITSQNHGFCVDAESLNNVGCDVTHIHLNDGTVAGFRHRELPVAGVQFHPEASPGPHEASVLFQWFADRMAEFRKAESVAG